MPVEKNVQFQEPLDEENQKQASYVPGDEIRLILQDLYRDLRGNVVPQGRHTVTGETTMNAAAAIFSLGSIPYGFLKGMTSMSFMNGGYKKLAVIKAESRDMNAISEKAANVANDMKKQINQMGSMYMTGWKFASSAIKASQPVVDNKVYTSIIPLSGVQQLAAEAYFGGNGIPFTRYSGDNPWPSLLLENGAAKTFDRALNAGATPAWADLGSYREINSDYKQIKTF